MIRSVPIRLGQAPVAGNIPLATYFDPASNATITLWANGTQTSAPSTPVTVTTPVSVSMPGPATPPAQSILPPTQVATAAPTASGGLFSDIPSWAPWAAAAVAALIILK